MTRRDERQQQVIRERAYAIWEQEGHPYGKDLANWLQAETEIDFDLNVFVWLTIAAPSAA